MMGLKSIAKGVIQNPSLKSALDKSRAPRVTWSGYIEVCLNFSTADLIYYCD